MARVFISYADPDRLLAAEVHRWLVANGHEVLLEWDRHDHNEVGEEWEVRLHQQLRWADAVLPIVTPAYNESSWNAAEIAIARSRGARLVPLLVESSSMHPLLRD